MSAWALLRFAGISLLPLFIAGHLLAASCTRPDTVTPDGGNYCGPLVNGKLHGRGVIEWSNGAVYEGEFAHGQMSGKGRLRTATGDLYEGVFRNGAHNGRGTAKLRNGSAYAGEFRNDYFHGNGRLESPDGYVYEGRFENGEYHGKGVLTGDGTRYQGEFRQGRYWGYGELKYADGEQFSGQFSRGRYDGKGRLTNAQGDIYEGEFKDGELLRGVLTRKDGSRYEGEFLKWRYHGKGKFTGAGGAVYEGTFTNGELSGPGKLTSKNRGVYEGQFSEWSFHGQGVLRLPNGDTYKGGFARGVYEGKGTLTYAVARPDGRTQDSGTWRFGTLENKAQEQRLMENVETALYAQRRILDSALAALAPRDPGKPNLYLLAIAGDGSQEVFRREVEFVRDQFAKRFGTASRAVSLINSRNTVASAPMATHTSLREALKRIAERMDMQEDILFLFLTSHGSREHAFTLGQSHMSLRNLNPQELGNMLKESGIRWKVIVISACYSGGFIDALKDEHTLIMTAARRDRQSFGCADENDFTYFGRAFFKEALPRAHSFEDAFRTASTLVREWEKKDVTPGGKFNEDLHSLPQMQGADAIAAQLRKWWSQLPKGKTP